MRAVSRTDATQWQALDGLQTKLVCNLVPLIELCQFASCAAGRLKEIQEAAVGDKAFEARLRAISPCFNSPDPAGITELVSEVLQIALREAADMSRDALDALDGPG